MPLAIRGAPHGTAATAAAAIEKRKEKNRLNGTSFIGRAISPPTTRRTPFRNHFHKSSGKLAQLIIMMTNYCEWRERWWFAMNVKKQRKQTSEKHSEQMDSVRSS